MTSTLDGSRRWSYGRWAGMIALVFGAQLGLVFWLGQTSPIRPRPAAPVFTFKLAGDASTELLALNDPTLFALPHRTGPAGLASLSPPQPDSESLQWPEPTNSLLLVVDQLGTLFSRLIETNGFHPPQSPTTIEPKLTLPDLVPLAISPEHSTLLLEGELAQRRLITPLPLRSWPNPDILANSVVRIAVDAEGRPVSPTLLSPSGSREADLYALEQARMARFEPVGRNPTDLTTHPAAPLTWGRMVFRWHTIPPAPTNAPTASP